jgi:dihydrofolate reductase
MRKLILKMQISLDGFVGGPNGEIDWIFRSLDESAGAWIVKTLWQAGAHIMGGVTYRDMAAHWPTSTEQYAPPMNQVPKVVFSRTLTDAPWGETTIARGALAEEIARLKRTPGKDILAHGGARFAQSLVRERLIDEYQLMIHPVALGNGLRLFADLPREMDLTLIDVVRFDHGTVAHVYRPA